MHGDSLSNDGVYGGYIPPRTAEGFYSLSLSTVDHQTNIYFKSPDILRFTTAGPIKLDSLPFGSISGFRYGFKPYLKNAGTVQGITNIKLRLTSNDPWITNINPAERNYGNLLPGQSYGGLQIFTVTYDSASFPGYFNLRFSVSSDGWSYWEIDTTIIVKPLDVEEEITEVPTEFLLSQNFPNPFNPSTKINWQMPARSQVTLKVYDVLGNEIVTLVNEEKEAGYHSIDFNASDLPSGVYFYKLTAGNFISTRKMLLLK